PAASAIAATAPSRTARCSPRCETASSLAIGSTAITRSPRSCLANRRCGLAAERRVPDRSRRTGAPGAHGGPEANRVETSDAPRRPRMRRLRPPPSSVPAVLGGGRRCVEYAPHVLRTPRTARVRLPRGRVGLIGEAGQQHHPRVEIREDLALLARSRALALRLLVAHFDPSLLSGIPVGDAAHTDTGPRRATARLRGPVQ